MQKISFKRGIHTKINKFSKNTISKKNSVVVLNESPEHFKNQEKLLDEPERLSTKDFIKIPADSLEQEFPEKSEKQTNQELLQIRESMPLCDSVIPQVNDVVNSAQPKVHQKRSIFKWELDGKFPSKDDAEAYFRTDWRFRRQLCGKLYYCCCFSSICKAGWSFLILILIFF
jgi:hypothetical protein